MRKLLVGAAVAVLCLSLPAAAQLLPPTNPAQRFSESAALVVQGSITGVVAPPGFGTVCVDTYGMSTVGIAISGTWVATLGWQISQDGNTYAAVNAYTQTTGQIRSSTTGNATMYLPVSGVASVCVAASSYTSGTAAVTLVASRSPFTPFQMPMSATALSLTNASSGPFAVPPGQWAVTSNPAAATQATATRAAGAATVRHVANCVTVGLVAVAAQAAPVVYNLRDGATGVGTVLWSVALIGQAGVAQPPVTLCGLNIPGTAATAMTLESAAAPALSNFAFVTLTGFDAQN